MRTDMLRQAALQLATLADDDRAWILDRLSSDERQKLEPLIAEVIALDLHRDPGVLEALSSTQPTISADTSAPQAAEVLAALPPFWRDIVTAGHEVSEATDTSTFLAMIGQRPSGPRSLQRHIIEIASARSAGAAGSGASDV